MKPVSNTAIAWRHSDAIMVAKANTSARFPSEEIERMSKRRFQRPIPVIEGGFWYLRVWTNTPGAARKRERIKLAPADTPKREVLKMAAERLNAVNRRLITSGSGVNFTVYVEETYL